MANTVKVTNISTKATERDLWDFFAFSGEVQNIVLQPGSDPSNQTAYVTFTEEKALETALLLTGAVIADRPVTVEAALDFVAPANQPPSNLQSDSQVPSSVSRASDVVANLLAKGYILSKDAASKAKSFDDKHGLSKTAAEKAAAISEGAATTAATLDRKIGLSQKVQEGVAVVNESFKSVDEKYKVTETSKFAFATAEQKVNEAASVLMKNQYVASSTAWVSKAFEKFKKVAEDVRTKTKAKVQEQEATAPTVDRAPSLSHPEFTLPPEPTPGVGGTTPVPPATAADQTLGSK